MNNKKYILSMFPYPSGNLHLGHVRVYTIADLYTRLNKLKQFDVINPMGWDAFGLPAENAAIERGILPKTWTLDNIQKMKSQFQHMDTNFDWDREVTTCDPDYYKWTQWIFLKLFEKGLAYKKDSEVLWDPVDQTVLANEQVDANGKSWRSGATVETKLLNQWFLKITDFADELNSDLHLLKEWPDSVKTMQENWIGKSFGTKISFNITINSENSDNVPVPVPLPTLVQVFTTRPDTLFGVTFMAIAPNHPISCAVMKTDPMLKQFTEESAQRRIQFPGSVEPHGYQLPNIYAVHPLTGENVPIYVADYVKMEYGTGAVMGVPAHDERDFQFANSFDIPIKRVLESVLNTDNNVSHNSSFDDSDDPTTISNSQSNSLNNTFSETIPSRDFGPGKHHNDLPLVHRDVKVVSSHPKVDNLDIDSAKMEIECLLKDQNAGHSEQVFRIRDWLISRQRYWGTPIPIIICPSCGPVPVPEKDLPVVLPDLDSISGVDLGSSGSPLASNDPIAIKWRSVHCPKCENIHATREVDTMDTFVDSSWYFLRYCDPKNDSLPFDPKLANQLMPVDMYIGGIEHAVLHLLYARFIHKFFVSLGMVDEQIREPFKMLLTQGLVTSKTYRVQNTGKYVPESEIEYNIKNQPVLKADQSPVSVSVEKMSKSKLNGMDPIQVIQDYGVDTTRLFLMFKAPPQKNLEWDLDAIQGQSRWIGRLTSAVETIVSKENNEQLNQNPKLPPKSFSNLERKVTHTLHSTIHRVERELNETFQINVAVAELMKLSNALSPSEFPQEFVSSSRIYHSAWKSLVIMLYPFCPSLSQQLWKILMNSDWKSRIIYSFPKSHPLHDAHSDLHASPASHSPSSSPSETGDKLTPPSEDHWEIDLWDGGQSEDISFGQWPNSLPSLLSAVDSHRAVIQVNGKTRGSVRINAKELERLTEESSHNEAIRQLLLDNEKILKWTTKIQISKIITPPIHKDNAGIPRVLCNFVGSKKVEIE